MARIKISEEVENVGTLEDAIVRYANNKAVMDEYKKLCDIDNKFIKEEMSNSNLTEAVSGDYVAKYSVATSESVDEPLLIDVLKKYNVNEVIKTREYVDMGALEDYIYNHQDATSLCGEVNNCITTKETVRLLVSKRKTKKGE